MTPPSRVRSAAEPGFFRAPAARTRKPAHNRADDPIALNPLPLPPDTAKGGRLRAGHPAEESNMIVFRGLGVLVLLIAAAAYFGGQFAVDKAFGPGYWQHNG